MKDNGRTIQLPLDTPLEIDLEGNATTGYQWEVASYDSTILQQMHTAKYYSKKDVPGAGGVYTFSFKTIDSGETTLELVYRRPFEKGVDPVKTFTLYVIAGTMGRIESE